MLMTRFVFAFIPFFSLLPVQAEFRPLGQWYQGQALPYLAHTLEAHTDRDLRFLYVLGRASNQMFHGLSVFALTDTGAPTVVQTMAEDAGYDRLAGAVRLRISPDDRFVYVSTYQHETYQHGLVVYARNENNGRLQFVTFQENIGVTLIGFDGSGAIAFGRDDDGLLTVLRRDEADGRLNVERTYAPGQTGSLEPITHWQWVAPRQLLLGYSPADTSVALLQFNNRNELTVTRRLQVDPNFLDPDHPLTFCHFSSDGRLLLLAGNRRRTIVQLYLDLEQATIADFRQTDLGSFDDVGYGELDHYTYSLFDEGRGRLMLFMSQGFWPDIVDIGFPFAANQTRDGLRLNGLNYALASFPLADGRLMTFPDPGVVRVLAAPSEDEDYVETQRYDQNQAFAGPQGPTDLVVAANCRDLYLADGENGLFHLQMESRDPSPKVMAHYQEPTAYEGEGAWDHDFGDVKLSAEGRFLYVLNGHSVRVYGRDLEEGRLWRLDRLELPFDQTRARFDLMHFSWADEQRQLLVFDTLGRIVAYDRNPDTGMLTHAQTIIGGADGAVPLRIWDSYALSADRHLFVFLDNAQLLIFQYEPGQGWLQRRMIDTWPEEVRLEYVTSVDFDEQRKQLWLRTLEGIRLFDWDAANLNLSYAGALALGDTDYEEIDPVGPLVFHGDRVYFGSTNDDTLFVFQHDGNHWQRIARIEDNNSGFNHIGDMSALAVHPSGTRLLVAARDDKALTIVDTTRARQTRRERGLVQRDRQALQPRRR